MRAAVEAAAAANVLLVCSAGNSGIDVDQTARVSRSSIAVAERRRRRRHRRRIEGRELPDFSNYGRLTVPVAAPGVEVVSTSQDRRLRVQVRHVDGRAARGRRRGADGLRRAAACPRRSCARCCSSTPSAPSEPVGSGIVDALGSVLAASGAASYSLGQPPQVQRPVRDPPGPRPVGAHPGADRAGRRDPGRQVPRLVASTAACRPAARRPHVHDRAHEGPDGPAAARRGAGRRRPRAGDGHVHGRRRCAPASAASARGGSVGGVGMGRLTARRAPLLAADLRRSATSSSSRRPSRRPARRRPRST